MTQANSQKIPEERNQPSLTEQTTLTDKTTAYTNTNLLSPIKAGSVTIETATLVRVTLRLRTSPQILLLTDRPSIPSKCHHNPHSLPR